MNCKYCVHYEACYYHDFEECEWFKDKSEWVHLPCKVGDMVYVPWRWGGQRAVATVKVEEIKFYDSQMHYMFLIDMESDNECFNQSFGGWKIGQSIGKTVFLTREEAEKALEDMRKEDEGEMKYYWFEFADGYRCCVIGLSKQELRVEENKHGKLLRKVEA